jgi:hypothetical protein
MGAQQMGRGLSDLQKRILSIVYERRQVHDFDQEKREWHELGVSNRLLQSFQYRVHHDVRHPEIIAKLYDWPLWWSSKDRRYLHPSEGASVKDWGKNWNRDVIGLAEYNRKTAAYYRAVSRLKARGLLADQGSGLWITDEGMRVVSPQHEVGQPGKIPGCG